MNSSLRWLRLIGPWIRPFFASLPRVAGFAPAITTTRPGSDVLISERIDRVGDRRIADRRNPTRSAGNVDLRDAPTTDNERRPT
jgi:hypothetical protein